METEITRLKNTKGLQYILGKEILFTCSVHINYLLHAEKRPCKQKKTDLFDLCNEFVTFVS